MKVKLSRERLAGDRVEWSLEVDRGGGLTVGERLALAEAGEARWRAIAEAVADSGDPTVAREALDRG